MERLEGAARLRTARTRAQARATGRSTVIGIALGTALVLALCGPVVADELIADGGFDGCASSKQLRRDNKGQDWYESRGDTKAGRRSLMLSTKDIGGNATHKAMIKADPEHNTYLSQRFSSPQTGDFVVEYDIHVRKILAGDNRSAFFLVGNDRDGKRGPNSTGNERLVFLGFENAGQAGKINLFAREGDSPWDKRTLVAKGLDLGTWYHIVVNVHVKKGRYEVTVAGVTEPVALKAFATKSKPPQRVTNLSFASWNDGAGTFYVDNVAAHTR